MELPTEVVNIFNTITNDSDAHVIALNNKIKILNANFIVQIQKAKNEINRLQRLNETLQAENTKLKQNLIHTSDS